MGKNIGIFGGSFDPIHYGHLLMAEQCREQARLDALLFIPANQSPLKTHSPRAEPRHRLEMLRLAISGHDAFAVDNLELERPGPSYTIDTLRAVQSRNPGDQLFLIVGSDALLDFGRWREPADILKLALPLVVARPGEAASLNLLRPLVSTDRWPKVQKGIVESPRSEISSSDMRRRIQSGRSIRYMTPRAVEMYIQAHRLYRSPEDLAAAEDSGAKSPTAS